MAGPAQAPRGVGGKTAPAPGEEALLLGCHEVPTSMTESFILSGYRRPGYTFTQCLLSAFRPTNETGNFWTHFLAVFIFAFHFLEQFWGQEGQAPGGLLDPFYYPLWSYFLGVCGLLLASSLAHLLNSMSLLVREICFYIDYSTISAYTVGSSLAYHYYIHPQGAPPNRSSSSSSLWPAGGSSAWLSPLAGPRFLEALYVPAACLVALFCTSACCSTRHQWPRHRYLIRTLVFLLPFLVVSSPVFHKLWRAGAGPGSSHLFFLRHCGWLLASGLFNISKVPERFSPGRFDIWGHSHQWFHCCTFLSILDELHMLQAEIRALATGRPPLPRAPTFLSTFGVMLLLLLLLAGIVAGFGARAYSASQQQHRPRGKQD